MKRTFSLRRLRRTSFQIRTAKRQTGQRRRRSFVLATSPIASAYCFRRPNWRRRLAEFGLGRFWIVDPFLERSAKTAPASAPIGRCIFGPRHDALMKASTFFTELRQARLRRLSIRYVADRKRNMHVGFGVGQFESILELSSNT